MVQENNALCVKQVGTCHGLLDSETVFTHNVGS